MAEIVNTAMSGDGPDYTVTLTDGRTRIIHANPVPDDAQAYVDAFEIDLMIRELAEAQGSD